MQSRIRSHVAAAMLLAPLGAALLAEPAVAQRAWVSPAPVIERFVVRPDGPLQAGAELRFRVVGAPYGRAWVDVPGVVRGLELREVRRGVYTGEYRVGRRDNLDAFHEAIAILESHGGRDIARADLRGLDREYGGGHGWGRDNRDPEISDMQPAPGERVAERRRTTISARLTDEGRGIDPNSVTLRVDGRDVTRHARIRDNQIHYRDDLGRGRHTAELTVRDRAGNTARRTWSFVVVDPRDGHAGRDPGRDAGREPARPPVVVPEGVSLAIAALQHGSVVDLRSQPLVVQGRTAPHADVTVSLELIGSQYGSMELEDAGDYRGRADANGQFAIAVPPRRGMPDTVAGYRLGVTAVRDGVTATEVLRLSQRR